MNLFTARLTGKMVSTEQFEDNMHEAQLRVIRYRQVEKSPELAEYLALKAEVESSAFQEHKQELINRKYRDTDEGRKTAFRDKLAGSLRMRGYKLAVDNQTFQAFLAFQQTEDFSKISSIKERMKSSELRMFNMIYRSAFYKNYMKVLNSDELKQLNELEAEINSEDFQKRDAVWSDSKRWQHSEEYQKEQRFKELAKMDDILPSTAGGGTSPRLTPSRPAAIVTANARYGFALGSAERSSILVPLPRAAGTRMSGLLFCADHAMYTGASNSGTRRLYEFTSGLVIAVMPLMCSIMPAIKLYAVLLKPTLSFSS